MHRSHKYADGGKVMRDHMKEMEKKPMPPKKPAPEMLGSGMAAGAGRVLRDARKKQMEELGLRNGGKVKGKC